MLTFHKHSPPGTGKTSTICGIVGAFLSSRSQSSTVIQATRTAAPAERTPPLKVLVCAPSNAAIDEVAKRLLAGIRAMGGRIIIPKIVRVGAEDAINISAKDISLDRLVDDRLEAGSKESQSSNSATTLASLRSEMDALRATRESKLQEMTNIHDNVSRLQALEQELKALNSKRMMLSQKFNRLKDQQTSNSRALDAARRKCRAEILTEADIICSTLSGSGHEAIENLDFEMVIIDEAAQSVELSSLIPLKFRAKRCIMVGGLSIYIMIEIRNRAHYIRADPQQLPPTVLSPLATKHGYGQSLFLRLQKRQPKAVHLLR